MTTLVSKSSQVAPITITILVPNIDEVIRTFDQIKVYRSVLGELGPWAEITDTASRINLTANGTAYKFSDPYGAPNYYYRITFYNAATPQESGPSDPELGDSDAAFDVISVQEAKDIYLVGVDLTDTTGTPFPEIHFEHSIRAAVSWLEHRLDLPILPEVIIDERHEYYAPEYDKYIWLNLDRYPLISIQEVRLVLPTNQLVTKFDPSWILPVKETGQLNIIPGSGQVALGVTNWNQLIRGGSNFMPQPLRVDYTAGFERGKVPATIKDTIGKIASFGPLNLAGDLLGGAGIASSSTSIDGLSQSVNTTSSPSYGGYGARLAQYSREIKEVIPTLRRYYHGPRMSVA